MTQQHRSTPGRALVISDGSVAGLVATAELQGRDGSALGAIGGVFAAQSLMYFLSAQQTADYFAAAGLDDQSGEEAEPSRFDGDALVGMQLASASLVLLPVIAGVLGYLVLRGLRPELRDML